MPILYDGRSRNVTRSGSDDSASVAAASKQNQTRQTGQTVTFATVAPCRHSLMSLAAALRHGVRPKRELATIDYPFQRPSRLLTFITSGATTSENAFASHDG